MCLAVKLTQSLFCTCAVWVAAGFEVLIHRSVTGCGQWDTPETEPSVLWTEEIPGVGFLYLPNFNSWQWGSTFALGFNMINKHLCLWSWQ